MDMEEQHLKDTADTLQGWSIRLTGADPRLSAEGFLIRTRHMGIYSKGSDKWSMCDNVLLTVETAYSA